MKPANFALLLCLMGIVGLVVAIIRGHHASRGPELEGSSSAPETNNLSDAFTQRYGFLPGPTTFSTWDGVPPPTLTESNAMVTVDAFIATNGWNMTTGAVGFGWGLIEQKLRPISALPWVQLKDREFRAITSEGILYVVLDSWHHNSSGVAYNPKTNRFDDLIAGFKPLGGHWYAWGQPEDPILLPKQYEGQTKNK